MSTSDAKLLLMNRYFIMELIVPTSLKSDIIVAIPSFDQLFCSYYPGSYFHTLFILTNYQSQTYYILKNNIQFIRQMQVDIERGGSRKEIIRWVNSLLDLKLSNVEQLGTGSVYCQLLDIIKPGTVPMNKVNWKANQEYEYINNFKLLQTSIQQIGFNLKLDVQKLVKCKYQDNFQLIQTFKKLIEKHGVPLDYCPFSRRNNQPELSEKKALITNKENFLRKSGSGFKLDFPMSSKSSTSKHFQFPSSSTPNTMKSSKQCLTSKVNISSFFPNKQKSDQEKLRLIKQVLQNNGECQLQEIRKIVFQGYDSEVQPEEQLDII